MTNSNTILHFDYVDGKVYTEVGDELPLYVNIYGEFPTWIAFSNPCRVTTSDKRNTEAVYVIAVSGAMKNDRTRDEWRGFVEIPKDKEEDDWSFVENVFHEELTLDVIRWHYIGEEPVSYIAQLESLTIGRQGSTEL